MLVRLAVIVFALAAAPVTASPSAAIYVTSAAAARPLAPDHARTLRAELGEAAAALPAGYSLDVRLVRLARDTRGGRRGEIAVHAEVAALVSDERGEARATTTARAVARGSARNGAVLERDAIAGAARELARTLATRMTVVATK